jgi:transposase
MKGAASGNQQLWQHVRQMNTDAVHQVARRIADVCAKYPGRVLLFERLRKIRAKGGSKSQRMNRKQANQVRGKINQRAREKAWASGSVRLRSIPTERASIALDAEPGERFSFQSGQRIKAKWGKLISCPVCHYKANADFNASLNVHRSFFS